METDNTQFTRWIKHFNMFSEQVIFRPIAYIALCIILFYQVHCLIETGICNYWIVGFCIAGLGNRIIENLILKILELISKNKSPTSEK